MGANTIERAAVERQAGGEPPQEPTIIHLTMVIRVMLIIGIGLILIGTAIGLISDGALPTPVISVSNLPSMLASFDAAAFITLGILTCLITPATYIFYMGVSYARAHDRMYTLIAGIVFLIIMGSIVEIGRAHV